MAWSAPETGLYAPAVIAVAQSRGYDHDAHLRALAGDSEDVMSLTHPANWLTEDEVEESTWLAWLTPEQARLYVEHRDTEVHTGDAYFDGCPTCNPDHFTADA